MHWDQSTGCLVVMYHYVRDAQETPFPSLNALHPHDFDRQLDWLERSHRVIGYDEFHAALTSGRSLDGTALLTFDDGFADHCEVAERLRARGWSGLFFVAGRALEDAPRLLNVHRTHFLLAALGAARFASELDDVLAAQSPAGPGLAHRPEVYRYDQHVDLSAKHLLNYELPFEVADYALEQMFARHIGDDSAFARSLYLSPDQIRAMADAGMTFGFHSESHRVLSRLSREEQGRELTHGVERIRACTGQESVPMCYPYGHRHTYNADTIDLLAACGYSMAFNTERRRARPSTATRYELPRFDTRDLPPFAEM